MWIITILDRDDVSAWPVYYTEDDALALKEMKEIADEHRDHVYKLFDSSVEERCEISEDMVSCGKCEKVWTLDGSAQRLK